MELQGSLERIQIADIVQILEMKNSTGVLCLDDGRGGRGRIFFRGGRMVHLVGPKGSTSPYVLSELFEWEVLPGAQFTFDSSGCATEESLHASNVNLLLDAAVAKDVFGRLKGKYGSLDCVPSLNPEPPREQVNMVPEDWMILRSLSPGRAIPDVLAESHLEPGLFYHSLVKLEEAGILVMESPKAENASRDVRGDFEVLLSAATEALGVLCQELGPMVVENFANLSMRSAEPRFQALTALVIRQTGFSCEVIPENLPELIVGFHDEPKAFGTALSTWLLDLRRRCGAIVRPLGRLSFRDLMPRHAEEAGELSFLEDGGRG